MIGIFTQADGAREASAVNISYILNSFQIGYDRRVRPNYGGIPVTVGVTLYILSIGDLSEKDMDFTFDMYFRQFWTDPRLSFDPVDFGINQLVVGSEYISLIWVPDTFFVNEKIALFHSVIIKSVIHPNINQTMPLLTLDGQIHTNLITASLSSWMVKTLFT